MNEDELDKELPSLDDELESDDERLSAAAAAAAALITGAANTASALWSLLARRAAAESSEPDELDSLIGAEDEPDATAEAHSPLGGDGGEATEAATESDEKDTIPVQTAPRARQAAAPDSIRPADVPKRPAAPVGANPPEGEDDDNTVEVRVSAKAPSARKQRESRKPRRNLAALLLDVVVEQLGEYLESSSSVERLIRTQTDRLLRELTHDPELGALIRVQVEQYIQELAAQPEKLAPLVRAQGDRYLAHLQQHPEQVEPLVRALAERYIEMLKQDPQALLPLVQRLGDAYINYLLDHPDAVQELIQGQSIGMAEQVMEDIRERAATSDSVLELFARQLLGRPPRESLPPPPPDVQAQAERRPLTGGRRRRRSRGGSA